MFLLKNAHSGGQAQTSPRQDLHQQLVVVDADLAVEDLLTGLPVVRHLGGDTRTVLEMRGDFLDSLQCTFQQWKVENCRKGCVRRLMIALPILLSHSMGNSDVTAN